MEHTSIQDVTIEDDRVRVVFHARNREQAWDAVDQIEADPIKGYAMIWHKVARRRRGGRLRILTVGFYPTGTLVLPGFDPTCHKHWRRALRAADQIAGTPEPQP